MTLPWSLTKTALYTICGICWILQSLPALFRYMEGNEIEKRQKSGQEQLVLPQLLFCNRFPFTQAGLSSLGQQFNRDSVLAYLRQWIDPSLGSLPPEDSLANPLAEADRQQAEQTIAQLLPNGRLKQRLEQLMPQCQDMVASCVLSGKQLSGFDCCRMVQPWLATPRGGICWPFVGNLSSVQSLLEYPRGMQITFQISRNSFLSSALSVHPGIDVFLMPPEMHSRLRVATNLDRAHPLNDKRSLSLLVRKEIWNDATSLCHSSAEHALKGQLVPGATAGMLCLLERAIEHCSCVPMLVVLWTLQNDLDSSFLRRFNASTICTVGEFSNCVRPFLEFGLPPAWTEYPVPASAQSELWLAVDQCRKSPMVCQSTHFPGHSNERDLPAEYRSTMDFVSRVSVSFDSLVVTELTSQKEMDLYHLLSAIGVNLWWFAIGHLIWSMCRFRCSRRGGKAAGGSRVEPKSPMIPPAASPSAGQQQGPSQGFPAAGVTVQPSSAAPRARQLPPLAIPNGNGNVGAGRRGSLSPDEAEQRSEMTDER